ncbi:MAG: putative molybdenum carrier protein [Planctomycetota bacterium]
MVDSEQSPESRHLHSITSGGQTGVDQAALDAALATGATGGLSASGNHPAFALADKPPVAHHSSVAGRDTAGAVGWCGSFNRALARCGRRGRLSRRGGRSGCRPGRRVRDRGRA